MPFGFDVSCGQTCADYVVFLVGVIYLQNVIVRAVIKSFFSGHASSATEEDKSTEEDLSVVVVSQAEQEHKLAHFGGLTEEYLEKIIEIGYIMMFAAACPLLALFALLHNLYDLRALASQFLIRYRRPSYRSLSHHLPLYPAPPFPPSLPPSCKISS